MFTQGNFGVGSCHCLHDNEGLGGWKFRKPEYQMCPKLNYYNQIQAIFCFLRYTALLILIVKIKPQDNCSVCILLWSYSFWNSYSLKTTDGHQENIQGWVGKIISRSPFGCLFVFSYTWLFLKYVSTILVVPPFIWTVRIWNSYLLSLLTPKLD